MMVAVGPINFSSALVIRVNQLVGNRLIDGILRFQMVMAEDHLRSIVCIVETAVDLTIAKIELEEICLRLAA